jgi:hypothetical protein
MSYILIIGSTSTLPQQTKHAPGMHPPKRNSSRPRTKNGPHALDLCIQCGMPQDSADKLGGSFFLHVKVDQAIARMAQAALEKAVIEGEERWLVQRM